jgi:hypothetical protein
VTAAAAAALSLAFLQAAAIPASAQTVRPAAVPSAAPWSWPTIPGCLADPEINVSGKRDYASPVCAVYDDLLKSGATDIELDSARHVNAQLGGVLYPAFVPGTEVVRFTVTPAFNATFERTNRLVRVSETRTGAMYGSWWTTTAQLQDGTTSLDAARIRAILALTYTPSCMAASTEVRPGVRAYMGVVAPAFDEPGGSIEFWFPPDAVVAGSVADVPGSAGCTR